MRLHYAIKNQLVGLMVRLLGILPMNLAQLLGYWIGILLWHTTSKTRQVCETNITACFPNLDAAEQRQLSYMSVINASTTLMEMLCIWRHSLHYGQKLIQSVHNEILLNQALQQKRGLLLILPHLGNWELTNHYITQKTTIVALYHPAKLSQLDQLMYAARIRTGTQMVPTNRAGVKALYQQLQQGGTVIILPDQEPTPNSGCFAPFFGASALTGVLVPRLLQNTGAQCLCIFTLRNASTQGFTTYILEPDPAIYASNMTYATAGLNHSIERCIQQNPHQYQWSYKRFKHRPEGEPNLY